MGYLDKTTIGGLDYMLHDNVARRTLSNVIRSKNIYAPEDRDIGMRFNNAQGGVSTSTQCDLSGYMPVEGEKTYVGKVWNNNAWSTSPYQANEYYVLYDANKGFVSAGAANTLVSGLAIPASGVAYMRVAIRKNTITAAPENAVIAIDTEFPENFDDQYVYSVATVEGVEEVVEGIEAQLDNKAAIDGSYTDLTAGSAEQLLATSGVTDREPYILRGTGGGLSVGDRVTEEIVGGTVAFNQLLHEIPNRSYDGVDATTTNGTVHIAGTPATANFYLIAGTSAIAAVEINWIKDHKYLITFGNAAYTGSNSGVRWYIPQDTETSTGEINLPANSQIINMPVSYKKYIQCRIAQSYAIDASYTPQIFDLTQMFGTSIADALYAMETATAGSGVAWFRRMYPAAYYAYNAGTLMSVETTGKRVTGANLWDEEVEVGDISSSTGENTTSSSVLRTKNYIPVTSGTTYYLRVGHLIGVTNPAGVKTRWYDSAKSFIGTSPTVNVNTTVTAPAGACYLRFVTQTSWNYGTTYLHDICINISDTAFNGQYEPYTTRTYPLADLTLRGIPKIADGRLYYDGDRYESSGTVTRRYALVDLGTLTWNYNDTYNLFYTNDLRSYVKTMFEFNCSAPLMRAAWTTTSVGDAPDKTCSRSLGTTKDLWVKWTTTTDPAVVKTALSGAYLVYELATPTTETAAPYTNPQLCDPHGTEEFIDERTVQVPVGHESLYRQNLREKLEHLPNCASGNGSYIVKQTNNQMTLEPLMSGLPSTSGLDTSTSYRLKAAYSGGSWTLSWEAIT